MKPSSLVDTLIVKATLETNEDKEWVSYARAFDKQLFADYLLLECISVISDAVERKEPASTYVSKLKRHFGK